MEASEAKSWAGKEVTVKLRGQIDSMDTIASLRGTLVAIGTEYLELENESYGRVMIPHSYVAIFFEGEQQKVNLGDLVGPGQ